MYTKHKLGVRVAQLKTVAIYPGIPADRSGLEVQEVQVDQTGLLLPKDRGIRDRQRNLTKKKQLV